MEAREFKTCPKCQAAFECGLSAGHENCWCFELPRVLPIVDQSDCLCPACLRAEIERRQKSRTEDRLPTDS